MKIAKPKGTADPMKVIWEKLESHYLQHLTNKTKHDFFCTETLPKLISIEPVTTRAKKAYVA